MACRRITHSRFYKHHPVTRRDKFDRVVTSVWTYEPKTCILTYGAVVYTKESPTDFWVRRVHKEEAMKRFTENPIRIKLVRVGLDRRELTSIAVDWFISTHLIFKVGTHNKEEVNVRRVQGECNVYDNFNEDYDYSLAPEDRDDYVPSDSDDSDSDDSDDDSSEDHENHNTKTGVVESGERGVIRYFPSWILGYISGVFTTYYLINHL